MANPISEQIAANVLSRMENITVSNGYEVNLKPVRANPQVGNTVENGTTIIREEDDDIEDGPPQEHIQRLKVFEINAFAIESEHSSTPYDTQLNKLQADIEKEVFTDPFWSDLASNTFLRGSRRLIDENGDSVGVQVTVVIQYRVLESDPYSQ